MHDGADYGLRISSYLRSITQSTPLEMPSQHVIDLCSLSDTVTKALANSPNQEVSKIALNLYTGGSALTTLGSRFKSTSLQDKNESEVKELLDQVAKCGKFPHRPSDLFLKVRLNALNGVSLSILMAILDIQ